MSVIQEIKDIIQNPEIFSGNERLYPYYYNLKLINAFFDSLPEDEVVAIRGGGYYFFCIYNMLSEKNQKKIRYIIDNSLEFNEDELEKTVITSYDLQYVKVSTIIIAIKYYEKNTIETIRVMSPGSRVVFLNEIFSDGNIDSIFDRIEANYKYVSDALKKQQKTENVLTITNLIGEYFHIKDFNNAFIWIDYLDSHYRDNQITKDLVDIKERILDLISSLKKKISGNKHIVINWVDALRYDEIDNIEYLEKIRDKAIFFENAYTVTPYTSAALKTIFTGKLYIDDKLFNTNSTDKLEESVLVRDLQSRGFNIVYLGEKIVGEFLHNWKIGLYKEVILAQEIPSSIYQWIALEYLESSDKKNAVIIHNLVETHCPYYNGKSSNLIKIEEPDFYDAFKEETKTEMQKEVKKQIKESQKYLGSILEFYGEIYNELPISIYMSDHGQYRGKKPMDVRGYTHVMFQILGKSISKRCEERLFSLKNFPLLLRDLIDCGLLQNEAFSNYVEYQLDDCYSLRTFDRYWSNVEGYREFYVQHRGIISLEDVYVRYVDGSQYYFVNNETENRIMDNEYYERVTVLEERCGRVFIDVNKYPKYRLTKKYYEVFGITPAKDNEYI